VHKIIMWKTNKHAFDSECIKMLLIWNVYYIIIWKMPHTYTYTQSLDLENVIQECNTFDSELTKNILEN